MNRNTANRIAITSAIAAVLLLCAYATGEHRQTMTMMTPPECIAAAPAAAPEDTQATSVAEAAAPDEATATADGASGDPDEAALSDEENKVRDTARDYVKKAYPHSKTDGVFLLGFCADDLYIAGVDTATGNNSDQRKTIDLLVRRYVRKNGNSYWRAESLTPEQSEKYHTAALAPCGQ